MLITVLYDSVISFTVFLLVIVLLFSFPQCCLQLPGKVDIFFEKYVELLAGSRLFCGAIHSSVRLHIGLRITPKEGTFTLNNAELVALWARTISSVNGTCNCLIFYWKNKILRTVGMKVIKGMIICRRVRSQSDHQVFFKNLNLLNEILYVDLDYRILTFPHTNFIMVYITIPVDIEYM